MQQTRKTISGLVSFMILAGALTLFGCSGDDNDEQVAATANAVNNKTFAFSSGEIFHSTLRNVPTTLAFSNDGANFTLASAGGTATGTNQFGSCILTVTSSTYAAGTGPQANEVITLDPCMVDSTTKLLTATRGAITISGAVGNPPLPTLGIVQVDRAGRVGVTTAISNPFFRETVAREQTSHDIINDDYNAESDPSKWVARFSPLFQPNLAILDSLDGVCGNQLLAGQPGVGRYKALGDILADDQLYLNTASGTCQQYLAVEANAAGIPNNDCGGRTPDYNTIDVTYSVLAAGALTGVSNGILSDTDGTHSLSVFPFIDLPVPFVKK
jgi:hypothetical protein